MPHVMLADADTQRRSDDYLRAETQRRFNRHVRNTARVVLHRQVFEMLLGGCDGDNTGLELPRFHTLSELAAGMFAYENRIA